MLFHNPKLQVHTTEDGEVIELPILLPSSWLGCILKNYKFLLCGGHDCDLHEQLSAFWTCFEFYQPGHVVFQKDKNILASTLPIVLHGDEGRYLKKGNFMVCAIESMLGSTDETKSKKKACDCSSDPALSRYGRISCGHVGDEVFMDAIKVASKQHVNDAGNEFLSKFLLFGMSSLIYKKHKAILKQAFDMVVSDMTALFETGLTIDGHTYYVATLGVKGDLKFHHQMGNLSRSYYNVGTKENHPICSLCLAGQDGILFEDVSDHPPWMETLYLQKPWSAGNAPGLSLLPFQNGCPEALFRLDLFHCWKCGLGRDLTGSTLIVLCQLKYFDYDCDTEFNLPARLNRAHSNFTLWCKATNKSPALHSFSKALLNYKNQQSFAWFNVKGSDNTLLTAWLLFVMKLSRATHGPRYPELEAAMLETFESAIVVFGVLHSHRLWMKRECSQRVQHHLTIMVRGYKVLALQAQRLSIVAYGIKPKLHAIDHIIKDLKRQLDSGAPRVLNPMAFSCEANESIVGHVSRLARRVSSRLVGTRVIDRICIKTKSLIRKLKAKLRPRPIGQKKSHR